jgi:hypothetical protein
MFLKAQIMYARERLAGARERRTLIDISEVAKASVRLINKKWRPDHNGRLDENNHSKKVRMHRELTCVRNSRKRSNR